MQDDDVDEDDYDSNEDGVDEQMASMVPRRADVVIVVEHRGYRSSDGCMRSARTVLLSTVQLEVGVVGF